MVALTKTGQYIVTPDNGTLSYIKKDVGIVAVREISEVENRRSVIRSCLIPSMVVMFMPIQVQN